MEEESELLQFPISLDAVVSIALNVENLKVVLEFLLGVIRKHEDVLKRLQARPIEPDSDPEESELPSLPTSLDPANQSSDSEALGKVLAHLQALIKRLKKRKREIFAENDRNNAQDKLLSALKERMEGLENQLQNRVSQVERRMEVAEDTVTAEMKRTDDLNAKIRELEEKQRNLEEKQRSLEEKETELEGKSKELEGKSKELEDKSKEMEEKSVKLEQKSEALDEKSKELEGKSEELEIRIRELERNKGENKTVVVRQEVERPPARQVKVPSPKRTPRDEGETLEDASELAQRIADLESRMSDADQRLLSCENAVSPIPSQLQTCETTISSLSSDLDALNSTVTSQGELLGELEAMNRDTQEKVGELQETSQEVKLAEKADQRAIADLEERLSALEKAHRGTDERSRENQSAIEELKKLLKALEEQLRDKADADALDMVKSALVGMSGKGGSAAALSMLPTKDSNLLHDLNRKISAIEDNLARLAGVNTASMKLTEYSDRLEAMEKAIKTKAATEDLDMLLGLLKRQRSDLDKLEQTLREIEERPTHISGSEQPSSEAIVKADSSKIIRLSRRLDSLEETVKSFNFPDMADMGKLTQEMKRLAEMQEELKAAMEKLRKELMGRMRELEELLGRKADQSMVLEVERNC